MVKERIPHSRHWLTQNPFPFRAFDEVTGSLHLLPPFENAKVDRAEKMQSAMVMRTRSVVVVETVGNMGGGGQGMIGQRRRALPQLVVPR